MYMGTLFWYKGVNKTIQGYHILYNGTTIQGFIWYKGKFYTRVSCWSFMAIVQCWTPFSCKDCCKFDHSGELIQHVKIIQQIFQWAQQEFFWIIPWNCKINIFIENSMNHGYFHEFNLLPILCWVSWIIPWNCKTIIFMENSMNKNFMDISMNLISFKFHGKIHEFVFIERSLIHQ